MKNEHEDVNKNVLNTSECEKEKEDKEDKKEGKNTILTTRSHRTIENKNVYKSEKRLRTSDHDTDSNTPKISFEFAKLTKFSKSLS